MRLTRLGTGLLLGSIVLAAVGFVLGLPAVVAIAAAGLVALILGAVVVVESPPIDVTRTVSRLEVERGTPAAVTLDFRSTRTRRPRAFTAIETVDGERRTAAMPALASGHSLPLTYEIETTRRGNVVAGPLLLQRMDAFGLIRAELRIGDTCSIAVRPRRHPLGLLPSGRLRDLEGPTREVSQGTASFHQLREYVPGDDMRHIHWRSSARTGTLMVKQLVDTTRPEIVVIVDNRLSAVDVDDFEEVVEVAASILAAADDEGFPSQLLFADGDNQTGPDGVPLAHIDRLTAIGLTEDDSLLELADALRACGRSLMFITGELGAPDFRIVTRIAQGFAPAFIVSVVSTRLAPFISPPGMVGIGCSSSAEFATHWSSMR